MTHQPQTNLNADRIQTMTTPTGTTFSLLPDDRGILIHGWRIERTKAPIANTQELDESVQTHTETMDDNNYQNASGVHCPEMTFLQNQLTLTHEPSGLRLSFETRPALTTCKHETTIAKPSNDTKAKPTTSSGTATTTTTPIAATPAPTPPTTSSSSPSSSSKLQVAAASKWSATNYSGLVEGGVKQVDLGFDWTYTPKYKGDVSIISNATPSQPITSTSTSASAATSTSPATTVTISPTTDDIPITLLQRPDPILWYDTLQFYEDELHDNGISSLTAKIRVMEGSFFILLQFWLRIDQILVRVHETRIFHQFENNFILREETRRENTFDELAQRGMPRTPSLYVDPSVVARKLTVKAVEKEKITLPSSNSAAVASG